MEGKEQTLDTRAFTGLERTKFFLDPPALGVDSPLPAFSPGRGAVGSGPEGGASSPSPSRLGLLGF